MKFSIILSALFFTTATAQEVAFTISEKELIPEGIDFDSIEQKFYISSIAKNKIVVIHNNKTADFIKSNQDGFMGGVGLHVDAKRKILWACTGNIMGKKFRTGIFAYNTKTKKLIQKAFYPIDTAKFFFNDLTIAEDGSVYITNTFDHSIWKWALNVKKPCKLQLLDSIKYPNGIAILPDNDFLIVTTSKGLQRVNINNGTVLPVEMLDGTVSSAGLDGIIFYKNSIIGVQNEFYRNSDMKIVRYYLSEDYTKIERTAIIDVGNTYFNVPTTLTVADGILYVIANSQLDNFDQMNLKVKFSEKLENVVVLKYKL